MTTIRALRKFGIVWLGQSVSMMGSGLTRFALGVWVFQKTGSVTQFSIIFVVALLPYVLISPVAGTLADRYNRRTVMILSDTGAGLSTLAIALLIFTGQIEVWHVYLVVGMNSFFGAFQEPAYAAAMPLLVPKEYLDRANGLVQMQLAISRLFIPLLAGILFVHPAFGIQGIMLIDGATFLFAISTLLLIRIPNPEPSSKEGEEKKSFWQDMLFGWKYIRARPGLLGLIAFYAIVNLSMAGATATFTPLVLTVTTPEGLGNMWSVAGAGMLVSSLIISSRGGPKRQIHGVLAFGGLMGLGMVFVGLRPSALLIGFGLTLTFVCLAVFETANQTLLQRKVVLDVQGRVFALRGMITTAALPVVVLSAGALADNFFEPLLAVDGALANSVGTIIGTGEGRGIGFIFSLIGIFLVGAAALGYLFPRLRLVEDELPDNEPPPDADAEEDIEEAVPAAASS